MAWCRVPWRTCRIPHTIIDVQVFVGTIDRLGELERLVAIGHPLGKGPQLAEAQHHPGTSNERAVARAVAKKVVAKTEGLGARLPLEGRQGLLQVLHGLTVITQAVIDPPHGEIALKLEPDIPEGGRYGVGALAVGQRRFVVLHLSECVG